MSDLLADFERDCAAAGVEPEDALRAGGVHPTLWRKWKRGARGPTLNSFEAARHGLLEIIHQRDPDAPPCGEAAA